MKRLVLSIMMVFAFAVAFMGCGGGDGNDVVVSGGTNNTDNTDCACGTPVLNNGTQWLNGKIPPGSDLSVSEGDYYLNTSNGDVYQFVSNEWLLIGSLKGANGETGAIGPIGPEGDSWKPLSGNGPPRLPGLLGDVYIELGTSLNFVNFWVWNDEEWRGPFSFQGATGLPGVDGRTMVKPPMFVYYTHSNKKIEIEWTPSLSENVVHYFVYASAYKNGTIYQKRIAVVDVPKTNVIVDREICFGKIAVPSQIVPMCISDEICFSNDDLVYVVASVDEDGFESAASNQANKK